MLRSIGTLTIDLLADSSHLLGRILLGSAVSLRGRQAKTLLLLGSLKGLSIPLIQGVRVNAGVRQVLLLLQVGSGNAATVTTKSTLLNCAAKLACHCLLIGLVQKRLLAPKYLVHIWTHVLVDLTGIQISSINVLTTGHRIPGSSLIVRLRSGLCAH